MRSIFLTTIFLVLGLVFGGPLHASKQDKNHEGGLKIINGDFANISTYEIDVAFLIANNIWGAGVIVDQQWIMTTAFNCLWVEPPYITVRLNSSFWAEGGVVIQAERHVLHPNYTGGWANNIALVKLANPITFGPGSRKGWYDSGKSLKIANKTYTVSGWGVRSSAFIKENQLQRISQTILSDEDCEKAGYNLTAATGSFCAFNPDGGPCVFDFGAPLNRLRTVVGLYQGSIDCTQPQTYPSLYVDVYQYRDWITSVIKSA